MKNSNCLEFQSGQIRIQTCKPKLILLNCLAETRRNKTTTDYPIRAGKTFQEESNNIYEIWSRTTLTNEFTKCKTTCFQKSRKRVVRKGHKDVNGIVQLYEYIISRPIGSRGRRWGSSPYVTTINQIYCSLLF